jgi:hypothetical protein
VRFRVKPKPNRQNFFASFLQERRLFFFEKKKQKTFTCWVAPLAVTRRADPTFCGAGGVFHKFL